MSTFLFASTSITAHTLNATKLVTGLTGGGHRVLWYAEERFRPHVERCGAEHLSPSPDAPGFEASLAVGTGGGELARVRALYRDHVVGMIPGQRADLERLTAGRGVDAVVSDTLIPAAGLAAANLGVRWATFGDGPLLWWDEHTPPFGAGLPPLGGRPGRHRNRTVQAAIDRWLFGPFMGALNEHRVDAGLPRATTMREATMSDSLHLQGCTPGLEYPRTPSPGHVHFVGALGPGEDAAPPPPAHLHRDHRARPLALLTQGTLRPDVDELAARATAALVAEGFDVLVAGVGDGSWNRWPGRVTVMDRVDYPCALGQADLFVTNGGYTGVTLAAAAGVPIVQAGNSEEKADIGARIAWAGIGASLRLTRPPVWLLRATIARVMGSPRRRAASERLRQEGLAHDAAVLGPRLLTSWAEGAARG